MNYHYKLSFLLLSLFLFFSTLGCNQNLKLTYLSKPEGARLYENGVFKGQCPLTLYYPVSGNERNRGVARIQPMIYKWIDGHKDDHKGIVNVGKMGYKLHFTITHRRPSELAIQYANALNEYNIALKEFERVTQQKANFRSMAAINSMPAKSPQAATAQTAGRAAALAGAARSGSAAAIARARLETARSRLLSLEQHWGKQK